MKRKPKFEIERPAPGIITCWEGYKEHQFPIFEQDGETVFVEWPTRSAFTFLLCGWLDAGSQRVLKKGPRAHDAPCGGAGCPPRPKSWPKGEKPTWPPDLLSH